MPIHCLQGALNAQEIEPWGKMAQEQLARRYHHTYFQAHAEEGKALTHMDDIPFTSPHLSRAALASTALIPDPPLVTRTSFYPQHPGWNIRERSPSVFTAAGVHGLCIPEFHGTCFTMHPVIYRVTQLRTGTRSSTRMRHS